MRTSATPITQLDELKAYLGKGFIVLFGSAVSGVMRPALPMVDDVTRTFLQQAGAQLQAGTWLERVAAGYAIALAEGYYKDLHKSTKFENFMWRLQHFLGKKEIDTLLARVYGCTGKQYNLNHSALAFLLQERHCLACLTTNFDNALELCLPTLQRYIHPNKPPSLPTERDAPILYKLHGDALAGSCVRTSPELSQAARADLRGQTPLFCSKATYEDKLRALGISDKSLLLDCERFRKSRNDLVHEKAIDLRTSKATLRFAQMEAQHAVNFVLRVSKLLSPNKLLKQRPRGWSSAGWPAKRGSTSGCSGPPLRKGRLLRGRR